MALASAARNGVVRQTRGILRGYLGALAIAAACTFLSLAGTAILQTTAFVLAFPLGVLAATARFGVGPAVLTAVTGILVFDYVYVPPSLAFAIPGLKDGITLAVMVAAGGLAGVLAEQLRRQVRSARRQTELEELRNALLSTLSHDLRTPLTVLVGASAALCEERLDPAQRREFSRMVADESSRLHRLVGNLLDLTRLEAGRIRVPQTAQAIDEVIGSALCRLERKLQGRSVRTHLSEGVPLAFFDPVLIEQVMINLIENAIRHGGPGVPIEIAAHAREDAIVIEVADRGPGVPSGEEEKVFGRFYRTQRAPDGGIGLGLTLCRAIVAAHDGRIWLTNRPGGGAVVSFVLPVCSAARTLQSPLSERILVEALR